jgi:hypothetical protein
MGNNLTKTPNFGSIKCFVSLNVGKYLVINQQRHFINTNQGIFFSMTGPAGSELSTLLHIPVTTHKGGTQWGDTMGRIQWEENNRKMRNVTFMLGK